MHRLLSSVASVLIACLFLFGCAGNNSPEDDPVRAITDSGGLLQPEQAGYNVHHYALDISVDPDEQAIDGAVEVHAAIHHPLEWFVLDLDTTFSVFSIEMRSDDTWSDVRFERRHGQLWAKFDRMKQPGDSLVVRVAYEGQPRVAPNPPWDGGFTWDETPEGDPWIATSVQTNGADLWWPVKDHPSDKPDSVAISVAVPEGLVVASNGVLEGEETQGGTTTFNWFTRHPLHTYNVALNIAPYEVLEAEYTSIDGTKMPLYFYTLPEVVEESERLLGQAKEHLEFFEEMLGPYPFRTEKYGIAYTPHLGMEHQTIIAYGDDFEDNEFGFDWIHHHELGHEWWGNLVSASDWRDFWIHESFCTYMQALYTEYVAGEEAYRQELQGYRDQISNVLPVAPRTTHSTNDIYFLDHPGGTSNHDLYYKGSWILHTLRWTIGDDDFFEALRQFAYPSEAHREATDGSQIRFATTDDFLTLVNELLGEDLSAFFEVYLRQEELPRLSTEEREDQLHLLWESPVDDFDVPVPVHINGDEHRVAMENGRGSIEIPTGSSVEVDPDKWLLRK